MAHEDKRTKETLRPPPNDLIALELDQRADRLDGISESITRQAKELRLTAARLRGEA